MCIVFSLSIHSYRRSGHAYTCQTVFVGKPPK
jgi:hypothetical protein